MAGPRSSYREFAPPAVLAPIVACLWEQRIDPDGAAGYEQPVFPDGCIDLVAADDGVVIAGPATRPEVASLDPGSVTVGLRFRPGAAPAVLGVAASELRDQAVALEELWGREGRFLVERSAGMTADERPATLLAATNGRLAANADAAVDPVARAVAGALGREPGRSLRALAAEVGLSDRQLRRRIEAAVGYSPRTLARVLRFQRFLAVVRSLPAARRDLAGVAATCGYADQAHLTRESRDLAGLPPGRLLAAEAERLVVVAPARRDAAA